MATVLGGTGERGRRRGTGLMPCPGCQHLFLFPLRAPARPPPFNLPIPVFLVLPASGHSRRQREGVGGDKAAKSGAEVRRQRMCPGLPPPLHLSIPAPLLQLSLPRDCRRNRGCSARHTARALGLLPGSMHCVVAGEKEQSEPAKVSLADGGDQMVLPGPPGISRRKILALCVCVCVCVCV